jgi:hypothetical protein
MVSHHVLGGLMGHRYHVARILPLALTLAIAATLIVAGTAWAIAPPTILGYTGGEQAYTVPSGVVAVGVAVQGAWGGQDSATGINQAGEGIEGYLDVAPGQGLFGEVGQNGSYAGGATFGGGGAAGQPPPTVGTSAGVYASSGGGASDVRTCSLHAASCAGGGTSLASRLIVAAGGGGWSGSGNGNAPTCSGPIASAGAADNVQQLPGGNPGGPLPVITAAGIVIPGFASEDHSSVMTINGSTDAAMGSAAAGAGGVLAGCSAGSLTFSNSVAGSSGSGPNGGSGGNASGLPPFAGSCSGASCADAGSGGGGGGGYFGGGGGATGYDTCVANPGGPCNAAGGGQGGAGGSSFVANRVQYPKAPGVLGSTGQVFIKFVPAIEIDTPANGAVYTRGQLVNASWSCGYDAATALGPGNNCTGTVPSGSPINTTPGTHTFTVGGKVNNNASQQLSASVTYTVRSGGGTRTVHASLGGLRFTLVGPADSIAKGSTLSVKLSKKGSSKTYKAVSYRYFLDRGVRHHKRVTAHGKRKTIYKPNLVTSKLGRHNLSTKGLSAGAHKLKVIILLRAVHHGHKPKTKTLTLTFPFHLT